MIIAQDWLKNYNVCTLINIIEEHGGTARFVGGCVRDSLLGRSVHDIDIATDLLPEKVLAIFKASNVTVIPTGLKHGTVTVVINNQSFEVTTLRTDEKCDGRHAEVKFTNSWQKDASRRDFTFNALYCDINGKIFDYFNGVEDLKNRRLRFIGNAESRIREDYLRILRAFRFYTSICQQPLSEDIINTCIKYGEKLDILSGERIRDEFFKILSYQNAVVGLSVMQNIGILKRIIPYDVDCTIIDHPELSGGSILVKLAALLRTNKDKKYILLDSIIKRFKISNLQQRTLSILVDNNIDFPLITQKQQQYIYKFGKEMYYNFLVISYAESKLSYEHFREHLEFANNFSIPEFPLFGRDLLSLGYKQNKDLGEVLQLAKSYWENNSYNLTKKELLSYAKSLLGNYKL